MRALLVLPPLLLAIAIARFGYDVPFMDEWEFLLPVIEKSMNGTLVFADLMAQNNEHRLLFPRLIMLPLARLTQWDLRWELALTYCFALVSFALLARFALKQTPAPLWLLPILSALHFSLAQWQVFMWSLHLQVALSALAALGAIMLLARQRVLYGHVVVAGMLALVAVFSHGSSWAIWPAGCCVIAFRTDYTGTQRTQYLIVWLTALATTAIFYFTGFVNTAASGRIAAMVTQPIGILRYMALYLGTPLFTVNMYGAIVAGAVGMLTLPFLAMRVWRANTLSPHARAGILGMAAFALSAALITASGRLYDAADQGMSSRYVPFSTFFWYAFVLLLAGVPASGQLHVRRVVAVFAALLTIVAAHGWYVCDERWDGIQPARDALIHGGDPAMLQRLHPRIHVVEQGRDFMRAHKLSVFRDE